MLILITNYINNQERKGRIKMKRGHWKVKFEFWVEGRDDVFDLEDLSEITQEHIVKSINEGYTSGEINEPDDKEE